MSDIIKEYLRIRDKQHSGKQLTTDELSYLEINKQSFIDYIKSTLIKKINI